MRNYKRKIKLIGIFHFSVYTLPKIDTDFSVALLHRNDGIISGDAVIGQYNLTSTNTIDQFIARFDSAGTCLGIEHFGPVSNYNMDVVVDSNNEIIVSAKITENLYLDQYLIEFDGYKNYYLAKHDSTINQIGEPTKSIATSELIIIPNPSDGTCSIQWPDEVNSLKEATLYIYDNEGRLLEKIAVLKNQAQAKLKLDYLAKGIYHAKLQQGNKSYTGKIVFL
ncbi:MAG: T9SS type A sorting domain-containing protein [Bacteroidota bacterium]|nr:T9SS type A sorting domain-containing protein [Bacteroidota bacterium]